MREKGLIPEGVRFQISIPNVNSVVRPLYFPDPADLGRVRPGYEDALAAELEAILKRIPHRDLAIQWDMAAEVQAVYGTQDYLRDAPDEHAIATNVASLRRLSSLLPEEVGLGFHFCFGTFGGWPRFEPDDLGKLVELANAAVAATGRRVDWVHIPMLDRVEDDFDAPLATLDVHGARVYLGMIHSMPNFPQRLSAARKFLPDFGVAAYCGFGRISPDRLSAIFRDHHRALELAQAAPL